MNEVLFIIIGAVAGLGIGYVVFAAARKKQLESEKSRILEEAKMQGENLKKERIMEAKEKYMQLRNLPLIPLDYFSSLWYGKWSDIFVASHSNFSFVCQVNIFKDRHSTQRITMKTSVSS